jgi:hypothetical protein
VIPVRGCGVGVVGSCRTGLTAGRLSHALDECEFAYWSEFTGRDPELELKTKGIDITSNEV